MVLLICIIIYFPKKVLHYLNKYSMWNFTSCRDLNPFLIYYYSLLLRRVLHLNYNEKASEMVWSKSWGTKLWWHEFQMVPGRNDVLEQCFFYSYLFSPQLFAILMICKSGRDKFNLHWWIIVVHPIPWNWFLLSIHYQKLNFLI